MIIFKDRQNSISKAAGEIYEIMVLYKSILEGVICHQHHQYKVQCSYINGMG